MTPEEQKAFDELKAKLKESEAKPKQLSQEDIDKKIEEYNKNARKHMAKTIKDFVPGFDDTLVDMEKVKRIENKSGTMIRRMLIDCENGAQVNVIKEQTEYGTDTKTFMVNTHNPNTGGYTTLTERTGLNVSAMVKIAQNIEVIEPEEKDEEDDDKET